MSDVKEKQDRKTGRNNHLIGKILCIMELIIAVCFCTVIGRLGVLPGKAFGVIAVMLMVLSLICLGLQFTKRKYYLIGVFVSLFLSIVLGAGCYYAYNVSKAMGKVGGVTYQTNNMVVVVRKDDPAETLLDAAGYQFGTQTDIDQNNTDKMKKKIRTLMDQSISYKEFDNATELAEGLLDGTIDAAVYNEGFDSMIEEELEGYGDKVRILYQYGIDSEIELAKENSVKKPFSVYISGIDVYGPITTNSRSDVNIIMTVNPKTKQILLATTPRDYYVEIPGISKGQKDKLTHAGIYGVDASMKTLEQVYGINLDYYARVNFSSLIKMVDILGGVDVYSEYAFDVSGYSYQKGMNHMDGEKALRFARERHSFEDGDRQRGRNQEAVIEGMIKKAMSPAILTNAIPLIENVSESVQTNMTQKEMSSLIRMQLEEGGEWTITSTNAGGTGDKQRCYSSGNLMLYVMQPDWNSVEEISQQMKKVIKGEPIQ